jgi:NADPH:quinone reductase-like Zn-dependent oxidoreductase
VPGPGEALVRVRAAALNPVDQAIAAGRFYLPVPDPPFVAGAEAVGEVVASDRHAPGTRVWCLAMTGGLAGALTVPDEALVPVPAGVPDALAAALGIAGLAGWIAVRGRGGLAPGERVVVTGAGGVVGRVAVQAARLGGADRVVAVARSAEGRAAALALGADEALAPGPDLGPALREATDGADLVIDTLWGEIAPACLAALRRGGRLVQVGNGAGPEAVVVAGPLRGGRLDLRGLSLFSEPPAEIAAAYPELLSAAAGGAIRVAVEELPLAEAPAAWARQAAGTGGVKLVLVP